MPISVPISIANSVHGFKRSGTLPSIKVAAVSARVVCRRLRSARVVRRARRQQRSLQHHELPAQPSHSTLRVRDRRTMGRPAQHGRRRLRHQPHHLGRRYGSHLRRFKGKERKGKEEYLYSTFLHQGTHKALRHGSQSFTCKQHHACQS